MGKGARQESSADTIHSTEVTTTTHLENVGVSGGDLVKIVDLIESAGVARASLAPVPYSQIQGYTSFAPAQTAVTTLPTESTGDGGGILYGGIALAAVVGLWLLLRRK